MALRPAFLRHLVGPTHDDLVTAVNDLFDQQGWRVQREPIVGSVRPDIVACAPSGTSYVIEVKQGGLDVNLGAVAQVEAFRNAVAEESGGDAKGMLVVAGEIPDDLGAVAERADIGVVQAGSADVGSLRRSLEQAGFPMNGSQPA